jgi:hypothetical protein
MYETQEQNEGVKKQPEHLQLAVEISAMACERFDPYQQNEFLKEISQRIKNNRQELIDNASKQVDYLKSSFEGL